MLPPLFKYFDTYNVDAVNEHNFSWNGGEAWTNYTLHL